MQRAVHCLTSLWVVSILLVLLSVPGIGALCAVEKYYSPQVCVARGVVVSVWECMDCPTQSRQYNYEGDKKDEACMCNAGYHAVYGKNRCDSYIGNSDGDPPVYDSFTCEQCRVGSNLDCPGGIVKIRESMFDSKTLDYEQCTVGDGCASGYRISKPQSSDRVRMMHMPRQTCMIFGQTSSSFLNCKCTDNSNVVYVPSSQRLQTSDTRNVWNYDISPGYTDPSQPNAKYFGYCQCKDGYYRSGSLCLICTTGFYCQNGVKTACNSGWGTSIAEGNSKPDQCDKCIACQQTESCSKTPLNSDGGGCQACPPGYKCNGLFSAPIQCAIGTYSPGGGTVCIPCQSGKYSGSIPSSTCTDCDPGKYSVPETTGGPITTCKECPMGKSLSSTAA
jgi:hypothetical protein